VKPYRELLDEWDILRNAREVRTLSHDEEWQLYQLTAELLIAGVSNEGVDGLYPPGVDKHVAIFAHTVILDCLAGHPPKALAGRAGRRTRSATQEEAIARAVAYGRLAADGVIPDPAAGKTVRAAFGITLSAWKRWRTYDPGAELPTFRAVIKQLPHDQRLNFARFWLADAAALYRRG
jgi:hypothetical protein